MKHTNISLICIISFFYCICTGVQAQTKGDMSSAFDLTTLLIHFEVNKQITFSYDTQSIKNIRLQFHKDIVSIEKISLDQLLVAIKDQTLLEIKQKGSSYLLYIANKPIVISGTVINLYTEKGLPEVLVTDDNTSVYTDAAGNFTIKTKAFNTLEFYFSGYKNKTMSVHSIPKTDPVLVPMQEYTEQLDEVVLIQDYLTLGIDKQRDGSMTISPKDMKLLPGLIEPNIMQSIQLLPGLDSSSEGVNDISTRGSTSDHNLILWDGIKIYSPGLFFDKLSTFNPYIVDEATISRSGTSARYGGRVGGVIDITSISKVPDRIKSSVGLNSTTADANLQLPLRKKLGIVVAGRHSISDIISTPKLNIIEDNVLTPTEQSELALTILDNAISFYDFNAKFIWDISEGNKLVISGIGNNNKFESQQIINATEENRNKNINYNTLGGSILWKWKLNSKLFSTFSSQYSNYEYLSESNLDFSANASALNAGISISNGVVDISNSYSLEYRLNDFLAISGGYEHTYNELLANWNIPLAESTLVDINEKVNTHGFYSEWKYNRKEILITAGIRGNYYSELNNLFWEPRISTSIELFKNINLNLSFERKSQAIRQNNEDPNVFSRSFIESNNLWISPTEYIEGLNDGLTQIPLLTTNQITTGVTLQKGGFDIDIDAYYKKNEGIITINNLGIGSRDIVSGERSGPSYTVFSGQGNAYGIDVLIKKKIRNYRTWLGYSFGENLISYPEAGIEEIPSSYNYRHTLNWSHTIDYNNIEFGMSYIYRSGTAYSIPSRYAELFNVADYDDYNLQYDKFNTELLPDYQSFNASLLYSINLNKNKTWKTKFGISVQNIFNKKNIIGRTFTRSMRNSAETIEVPYQDLEGFIESDIKLYQNDNIGLPMTVDFLVRMSF